MMDFGEEGNVEEEENFEDYVKNLENEQA